MGEMASKGIAAASVSAARLTCCPDGLIAALKVLNSFHGLRPRKNLVGPSPPRGLGSGPISQLVKQKRTTVKWFFCFRAGKGTRTLDPDLGKVVLYQLSYSRGVAQL